MPSILQLLTEFLGTFVFLYVIVATGNAWLIGLTLALLILVGGPVSGGNFNPAVSIMSWYNRALSTESAAAYVVAQVLGGIAAVSVHNQIVKRA